MYATWPRSTPKGHCGVASEKTSPLPCLAQTSAWQQRWRSNTIEPSLSSRVGVSVSIIYQKMDCANSRSLSLLASELRTSLQESRLHTFFSHPSSKRAHSRLNLGKMRLKMWETYQGKDDKRSWVAPKINHIYHASHTSKCENRRNIFQTFKSQKMDHPLNLSWKPTGRSLTWIKENEAMGPRKQASIPDKTKETLCWWWKEPPDWWLGSRSRWQPTQPRAGGLREAEGLAAERQMTSQCECCEGN